MKAALIFSAALCVLIGALPEPAQASQVVGSGTTEIGAAGSTDVRRECGGSFATIRDPPIAATIPGFGNRCAAGRLA